jgi:hypothetical protein
VCVVEERVNPLGHARPPLRAPHVGIQPGRRPQLAGVGHRVAERFPATLGDQVGEVGLEAVQDVALLLRVEVGQLRAHGSEEVPDLGGDRGGVHAVTPSRLRFRIPVTVVAKTSQSSRCCLSCARPVDVMP